MRTSSHVRCPAGGATCGCRIRDRVLFNARPPPSWSLMHRVLYRLLVAIVGLLARSGRDKDLEIVVLRHQLTVLRRQIDRAALSEPYRTLLGAIAAVLPRSRRAGWLVTPDASALASSPHRPPLDPTPPTRRPAAHPRLRPPTRGADGTREPDLGLPADPGRTRRPGPHARCIHGLADPQGRRHRPRTHTHVRDVAAAAAFPRRGRVRLRTRRHRPAAPSVRAVLHRRDHPAR